MKNLYFILMFVLSTFGFGQNAGFFGSPLSSVIYNDGSAKDQEANVFNGTNLGVITNLELNGARIQTFKNGGADVTGAFIHYRVFEQGTTAPSFTIQSINFDVNLGGGGDQRWEQSNLTIDLLSGLNEGNYIFEIFFRITTTGCCSGEVFQSNSGGNYSANFSIPYISAQSGNWSAGSTWTNGVVPVSGADVIISPGHNVFLDQDAEVSNITTSAMPTGRLIFLAGQRTLRIRDGGSFINNGNFGSNDGTVSFLGAGSVSGPSTLFENVDIAGGVDFGLNSTIDRELTIETGGFVVNNPPIYSSNSTLIYSDDGNIYNRGLEWSSLTGRGYPNNVAIRDNTTLNLGANSGTGTRRQCRGNLTVEAGSTLTLAGPDMTETLTVLGDFLNQGTVTLSGAVGGDLVLQGNFDDDDTFTSNNRAVFFTGGNPQTVNSTTDPLTIDFIVIDKFANNVQMLQNLDLPNNLEMTQGNLDLNGNTLTISGDIRPSSGAGKIIASAPGSTIIFDDSSTARTIEALDIDSNNIANLTFNESAGITINTDLTVNETFTINAGENRLSSEYVLDLDTATMNVASGSFIFGSDSSGSAQLADATGATITGEVTVERYIPANRAYRLLSSPVTTSGTIFENWQENGIYPTSANGIGTHITGFQGTVGQFDASSGLDQTASGNPSMFTFDNTFIPTGAQTQFDGWDVVASTNQTGNNLNAETPYLLFVRGDRSIDLASNSSTPNNTTLSATGNIFTGLSTQTLSGQPDYFSLVANPFQAIVDFNALTFTGLGNPNFMYVYDPAQKDYVTLDANVPADVPDMFIRPGQSVFVVNSPGTATASTVQFEQTDINTSPSPGPGTTVFSDDFMAKLELELYNGSGELRENLRISFEDNASNAIDEFDAPKLTGGSEILASVNSGNIYTIERRAQVQSTDQVSILLDQYQGTDYEFRVTLENWNPDVEIFVADNYLGSTTQITPDQAYVFTVDSSIPESISENRFSLIFDNTTLGVDDNTFGSDFALYPNPTTDGQFSINTPNLSGDVNVEITSLLGQNVYSKDLSISGTQVDVNATGLSSGVYVVKLTQGNQSFSTKLIVE